MKNNSRAKVCVYEICWHNLIVAGSLYEALEIVKSVLVDLEKLAQWEKEGKISGYCGDSSPSIQIIEVLDKSIEPELQKINLVSYYELEDEEMDCTSEDET